MPTNSEHDRLLMHFDDGMDEIITLPDNTVRLTGEAVVARCKCARCAVRPEAEDGGCTLPLPPARPRRRPRRSCSKPGLNLVWLMGSPTQAEPCLDPVYRKQNDRGVPYHAVSTLSSAQVLKTNLVRVRSVINWV